MKCQKCGSEIDGAKKFCTNCGAPLGEVTALMDRVPPPPGKPPSTDQEPTRAFAQPPAPPSVTIPAPAPPVTGAGMKKATKVIISVVVSLVILGGAAAGFIIWRVVTGNKLVSEITDIELARVDGKSLNQRDVPIDVDLVLKVTYRSRFKNNGKASLEITVVDGNGEETLNDSFKPRSSDDAQEYEYDFYIMLSEGETFKATARLEVREGDKKLTDSESLEFYVKEGKGEELKLEDAKKAASEKIEEAKNLLTQAAAEGIETADLAERLSTLESGLDSATTEEESKAFYAATEKIISECNARRAAAADQAAREQDIAACRQVMHDYTYARRGSCEDIWFLSFDMNNERTAAWSTIEGMITAHTDPDRAGERVLFHLIAEKQGGQWVVTDMSVD